MKIHQNLSQFNQRMVEEVRGTFAANVAPYQSEDGDLLFRGPILNHADPTHIGTHVVVSLEKDVRTALENASDAEREETISDLLASLGSQLTASYDPKNIGTFALKIVGNMSVISGV